MLQAVRLLTELARISDDRQRGSNRAMDGRTSSIDYEGSVQFREIHKNGWLRRADKSDKELSRFWVAFCVHDDVEPRLEGFVDQKQATTHSPMWAYSLRNALYLSPTLCATPKNDYEFCVHFNDDRVIRLAASTYQTMYDWVQVVTRKLTDMKILRPKENIYSKGPERIATRDPTSPLPPPPVIPGTPVDSAIPGSASSTSSASTSNSGRETTTETSSSPTVFTFDDVSIEERRPRLMQTQTLRSITSTMNSRPPLVPTVAVNTDESNDASYESIFLASSSTSHVLSDEIGRIMINDRDQNLPQGNESGERYAALMEYRSAAGIRNPSPPPRIIGETRGASNIRRRLTLREQQVSQLKREMSHPAGVRLQLGRRDCKDGIAFVDTFGAVWVAGWKQREHPLLYNVLHIGDLVLSIAGVSPTGAATVKDILRNYTSPRVEVIVRRLPYARALILTKRSESEDFGLEVNGNEIIHVSGAAQAAGLISSTSAADPTSPLDSCVTWSLTELNGRPLNIFDGCVRDKLCAVGCDVSIVVQPTDFIISLRKKLRSIRGYKSYTAQ